MSVNWKCFYTLARTCKFPWPGRSLTQGTTLLARNALFNGSYEYNWRLSAKNLYWQNLWRAIPSQHDSVVKALAMDFRVCDVCSTWEQVKQRRTHWRRLKLIFFSACGLLNVPENICGRAKKDERIEWRWAQSDGSLIQMGNRARTF